MRCHMRPPKEKCGNLISSNSVVGMYFPACWLFNPNVHRLLKPVHLSTPTLPNILYLIFLRAGFFLRDPIPIFNSLVYTVCICWREMGFTLLFGFAVILHYLYKNWPPLLVLTCWQRDEKLEVFCEHK